MWAAAIGRYLVGQVTEIRLLAHLARLRWAKSLISTLIAAAPKLVLHEYPNVADQMWVACQLGASLEPDVGLVGVVCDDQCRVGAGVSVVHTPCGWNRTPWSPWVGG